MLTRSVAGRPTIVLLHDLWMLPRSFEDWVDYFDQRGFTARAPAWPGAHVSVDALRHDPSILGGLTIGALADYFEEYVRALRGPVILIGHGFGGLLVQLLVDRGLGDAGVLIGSTPTAGVTIVPREIVLSRWPLCGRSVVRGATVALTPSQFNRRVANDLDAVAARAVYVRYCIPAPVSILHELSIAPLVPWASTRVNYFNAFRAPLLFLAGGADRHVPPSINRRNAACYARSGAVTHYHETPGRTHFTLGQPGWTRVADHALDWALRNGRQRQPFEREYWRAQPVV